MLVVGVCDGRFLPVPSCAPAGRCPSASRRCERHVAGPVLHVHWAPAGQKLHGYSCVFPRTRRRPAQAVPPPADVGNAAAIRTCSFAPAATSSPAPSAFRAPPSCARAASALCVRAPRAPRRRLRSGRVRRAPGDRNAAAFRQWASPPTDASARSCSRVPRRALVRPHGGTSRHPDTASATSRARCQAHSAGTGRRARAGGGDEEAPGSDYELR